MDDESMKYLQSSLNNDNNQPIFDLTNSSISKNKDSILSDLPITKKNLNDLKKKLFDYRFVDEIQELHIGTHTRWINLKTLSESLDHKKKNYDVPLNKGGILSEINIDDNINLVIKTYTNKFFTINMDENLIFQKLTNQEKIILFTIDNIDNIKD